MGQACQDCGIVAGVGIFQERQRLLPLTHRNAGLCKNHTAQPARLGLFLLLGIQALEEPIGALVLITSAGRCDDVSKYGVIGG